MIWKFVFVPRLLSLFCLMTMNYNAKNIANMNIICKWALNCIELHCQLVANTLNLYKGYCGSRDSKNSSHLISIIVEIISLNCNLPEKHLLRNLCTCIWYHHRIQTGQLLSLMTEISDEYWRIAGNYCLHMLLCVHFDCIKKYSEFLTLNHSIRQHQNQQHLPHTCICHL